MERWSVHKRRGETRSVTTQPSSEETLRLTALVLPASVAQRPCPQAEDACSSQGGKSRPGLSVFLQLGVLVYLDVCVWNGETVTSKNTDCTYSCMGPSLWAFLWFINVFLQLLELLHDRHFWVPPFLPFAPLEEYALKPARETALCLGEESIFQRCATLTAAFRSHIDTRKSSGQETVTWG